jgi:hypothetical protein
MGTLTIRGTRPKIKQFTSFEFNYLRTGGRKGTVEATSLYEDWVKEEDVIVDGVDISADGKTITVSYHEYMGDD